MLKTYEAMVIESPFDTTVSLYKTRKEAKKSMLEVVADCTLERDPHDKPAKNKKYFLYNDDEGDDWTITLMTVDAPV